MRGDVTCITGTASSGKSSFSRRICEHSFIPWAIKNGRNVHIIRFGLEESKEQYEMSLLSYWFYQRYKKEYNIKDFLSIGRTIEESDIPLLRKTEELVGKMKKYISYETNDYNSFGIWKKVREFASKRGKFYKNGIQIDVEKGGWDEYRPDDPDEFVVVIVDNLSYITTQENEKDRHQAIWNTVENLRKYAALKLNYIVVFLQHQDATSENQESRKTGTILPTENGLA
jgi:hypothetical protein